MTNERFEGLYGRVYTRVIQTRRLRRAVFSLWGSADPLLHLDEIVAAAADEAGGGTILDVPCGGGTLLALLEQAGFRGTVIESDLADAMMRRAQASHARLGAGYEVRFIQSDARELPLQPDSVDAVISINGLHVIPSPERFLAELARVLRPGGTLWLVTPVNSSALRSRGILAAARALRITPATPPTMAELHEMVEHAGLEIRRSLGGTSITGLVVDRPGPMITIATLAEHPQLVPDVVELAWREWGALQPEHEHARWLREAERDSRLHSPTSAAFVALDGDRAVGVVQLHEFELDDMRDRSPWVCGMVVLPEYRGAGIGSRLLAALERFAAGQRVPRLWVFTEHAAAFYERCGWQRHGVAVQDDGPGIVLTRVLL